MRIFNKRPIFLFAVSLLAAIILIVYNPIDRLVISLAIICGVLVVTSLILLCTIKKFRYALSRTLIVSFAILLAVASVKISETIYQKDEFKYDGYAVVSARISDVSEVYNGNRVRIILDDATITTPDFTKKLKSKISLAVLTDGGTDKLKVGNVIDASAKVTFSKLYYKGSSGLTFYYKNKNICATGYATIKNIEVVSTNHLSLSDRVRQKVTDIVNGNLDKEYAGLALGMLFGERESLDKEISSEFSAVGIAHLLAVSGLHVGFLAAILIAICKLCKIKGIYRFLLVSSVLIFYGYLCGFTVSVVRACIMSICMLYAGSRAKKYDSLNALSFSLILILLINPFSVDMVGFRLSFMAVFSIIMLAPPLTNLLSKILKRKIAQTISVILAVQIGLTCIMAMHFKNLTLVSIIANFVCIPISAIAYEALFVTVILSLIIPPLGLSVYLFQFIMSAVVKFVHVLAPIKALSIDAWQGVALTAITLPGIYFSSNYIFYNKKFRIILCSLLWISATIVLFV